MAVFVWEVWNSARSAILTIARERIHSYGFAFEGKKVLIGK